MELLSLPEFFDLSVASHIPLNMIIKDVSKLDEDEIKYMMNSLTHVDFVIFRKVDKSIVLIIEVDGYEFHKEGTKQSIRDRKKDSILNKYAVDFLRLNTTGSGEKEKIREVLGSVKVGYQ